MPAPTRREAITLFASAGLGLALGCKEKASPAPSTLEKTIATPQMLKGFSPQLPAIVTIGAQWCGPCRALEEYLQTIREEVPAYTQTFLDFGWTRDGPIWGAADRRFDLTGQYPRQDGVFPIPMIIVYRPDVPTRFYRGFDAQGATTDEFSSGRLVRGGVKVLDAILQP